MISKISMDSKRVKSARQTIGSFEMSWRQAEARCPVFRSLLNFLQPDLSYLDFSVSVSWSINEVENHTSIIVLWWECMVCGTLKQLLTIAVF